MTYIQETVCGFHANILPPYIRHLSVLRLWYGRGPGTSLPDDCAAPLNRSYTDVDSEASSPSRTFHRCPMAVDPGLGVHC
jgi:hypothetical protein